MYLKLLGKVKEKLGPLWFLFKFFTAYLVLFLAYSVFLDFSEGSGGPLACDTITVQVAKDSNKLVNLFGYQGETRPSPYFRSEDLYVNGKVIARVIEGCNAMSIMILFAAFVWAFASKPKPTLVFLVAGLAILYITNILRIAFLTIGLYEAPEYRVLLHDYIFPAILYGVTLSMWLFWLKKYAPRPQKSKNEVK
jgi:exosortase family protein XrtF